MAMTPVKTIEEFVRLYDKDLRRILLSGSFRGYYDSEQLDDVVNDVYANLIHSDFFNKYDSSKGAFTTFLYRHIWTLLNTARTLRIKKQEVNPDMSLDDPIGESGHLRGDIISIQKEKNSMDELLQEWRFIYDDVMICLKRKHKKFDAVKFFEMIQNGKMNKEIATAFNYTDRTVIQLKAVILNEVKSCVTQVKQKHKPVVIREKPVTPRIKKSRTGLKGAYFYGGRWRSQIWTNKQNINLGSFDTAEEAHAVYMKAKEQYPNKKAGRKSKRDNSPIIDSDKGKS